MQISKWVTLAMGILFLIIVASMLRAANLYYMAAVLLSLPAFSYLIGWNSLRGMTFERELPSVLWEGEEAEIVYLAQNPTALTRFFLSISEHFPPAVESLDEEPVLFNVSGRDSARIAHKLRFKKRGVFAVQSFYVNAIDPLGIFTFSREVRCEGDIVVYPKPQPIGMLSLVGTERHGWQEFTVSAPRGGSIEPDGVREYTPGDSLRRIHWKQTARTGKLAVLEFEEAQSMQLALFLDIQRGYEVGKEIDTTFEYAIRYAASAIQQAINQGAGVRLLHSEFDGATLSGESSLSGRGESHFLSMMDTLARLKAVSTQKAEDALTECAALLQPGSTLLIVSSQSNEAFTEALANIAQNGRFRVAFVFIDPESFTNSKLPFFQPDMSKFFNDLVSSGIQVFVLKSNAEKSVTPEAKTFV